MKSQYYKIDPRAIVKDIIKTGKEKLRSVVQGLEFDTYPNVYPSARFRSTQFIFDNIITKVKDKVVCDMGCGSGVLGLFSLKNGAKKVVSADVNPFAFENAIENSRKSGYNESNHEVLLSDCFDGIPLQNFDLIIFNIPFHSDNISIENPLEKAFFDPEFATVKKFLIQCKSYTSNETEIVIAFSNKGDTKALESIFDMLEFKWRLWKVKNTDSEYDNRLYIMKVAQ
jgi:methylase of polypeptide subunit release factors